jgi:hypothetical protein
MERSRVLQPSTISGLRLTVNISPECTSVLQEVSHNYPGALLSAQSLLSKTDGDPERQHLRMMKLRALTRLNENDTPRMLS